MNKKRTVVVTGDITIEWRFAQSRLKESAGPFLNPYNYMQLTREPAGAMLLADIIREAISLIASEGSERAKELEVLAPARVQSKGKKSADNEEWASGFWHSYIVCSEQPQLRKPDNPDQKQPDHVWRVKERIGIDRSAPGSLSQHAEMLRIADDRGGADLIIAEQSKQGFFPEPFDAPPPIWPESLRAPSPHTWILVEWTQPRFDSPSAFWSYISTHFKNRIVAILSIEDLRLFGMHVSRAFSWERTVEELCYELNASRESFEGCAHVIVSFGLSGAVLYSFGDGTWSATLYYEPPRLEGMSAEAFVGDMTGGTRCLTASVALEMLLADTLGTLRGQGVRAGIVAARRLWHEGFLSVGTPKRTDTSLGDKLLFPTKHVAAAIVGALVDPERARQEAGANGASPRSEREKELLRIKAARDWARDSGKAIVDAKIPDVITALGPQPGPNGDATAAARRGSRRLPPETDKPDWSLLTERFNGREILRVATEIIEFGDPAQLSHVPTARIGKVLVTDRKELESLRALRELITNYLKSGSTSTPLAIAVFGKPGSGKSFAIKELANDLLGAHRKSEPLTFNLSQFADEDALWGALQRVQDESSTGRVPLVFWDEFDTTFHSRFGWLRYFLAPMQDGQFQEGAITHNVGRSIFVFAGATRHKMREFQDEMEKAENNDAKIKDFISRLKGYVDIPDLDYAGKGEATAIDRLDSAIVLRRALLLRAFLSNSAGSLEQAVPTEDTIRERLNIDHGLIEAFLRITKYNYGARSMEAIVKMSALSGKTMFDRSSLPPPDQMALHVNARAFLQLAAHKWAGEYERNQSGNAVPL